MVSRFVIEYPFAMNNTDPRFIEYYSKGNYRNFRKIRGYKNKLALTTHLIFSNGVKQVYASGLFEEEALAKIFDKVDRFYR